MAISAKLSTTSAACLVLCAAASHFGPAVPQDDQPMSYVGINPRADFELTRAAEIHADETPPAPSPGSGLVETSMAAETGLVETSMEAETVSDTIHQKTSATASPWLVAAIDYLNGLVEKGGMSQSPSEEGLWQSQAVAMKLLTQWNLGDFSVPPGATPADVTSAVSQKMQADPLFSASLTQVVSAISQQQPAMLKSMFGMLVTGKMMTSEKLSNLKLLLDHCHRVVKRNVMKSDRLASFVAAMVVPSQSVADVYKPQSFFQANLAGMIEHPGYLLASPWMVEAIIYLNANVNYEGLWRKSGNKGRINELVARWKKVDLVRVLPLKFTAEDVSDGVVRFYVRPFSIEDADRVSKATTGKNPTQRAQNALPIMLKLIKEMDVEKRWNLKLLLDHFHLLVMNEKTNKMNLEAALTCVKDVLGLPAVMPHWPRGFFRLWMERMIKNGAHFA